MDTTPTAINRLATAYDAAAQAADLCAKAPLDPTRVRVLFHVMRKLEAERRAAGLPAWPMVA